MKLRVAIETESNWGVYWVEGTEQEAVSRLAQMNLFNWIKEGQIEQETIQDIDENIEAMENNRMDLQEVADFMKEHAYFRIQWQELEEEQYNKELAEVGKNYIEFDNEDEFAEFCYKKYAVVASNYSKYDF